jgi:acyl carrier protein
MTFDKVKEMMISTLNCDEDKITPEATIADDLGIDSLDAVELVMALEEEYGIKIPDEELGNMEKVSDIVACVDKYKA